jgi:hypothetical protein
MAKDAKGHGSERCDEVVIALRTANRVLAIDLMTGQISDDPLWPDHGVVIPFKRRQVQPTN